MLNSILCCHYNDQRQRKRGGTRVWNTRISLVCTSGIIGAGPRATETGQTCHPQRCPIRPRLGDPAKGELLAADVGPVKRAFLTRASLTPSCRKRTYYFQHAIAYTVCSFENFDRFHGSAPFIWDRRNR